MAFVYLFGFATYITDLVAVFVDYGPGWAIGALIFFPITMVVAPITALINEPSDALPLTMTIAFALLYFIGIMTGGKEE